MVTLAVCCWMPLALLMLSRHSSALHYSMWRHAATVHYTTVCGDMQLLYIQVPLVNQLPDSLYPIHILLLHMRQMVTLVAVPRLKTGHVTDSRKSSVPMSILVPPPFTIWNEDMPLHANTFIFSMRHGCLERLIWKDGIIPLLTRERGIENQRKKKLSRTKMIGWISLQQTL